MLPLFINISPFSAPFSNSPVHQMQTQRLTRARVQHLHQLYILELPIILRWVLGARHTPQWPHLGVHKLSLLFSAGFPAMSVNQDQARVQHYPARLHQLYILELPIILRWVLGAVKLLIHPSTAGRIRTCTAAEGCLPLPITALDESVSTSVQPFRF